MTHLDLFTQKHGLISMTDTILQVVGSSRIPSLTAELVEVLIKNQYVGRRVMWGLRGMFRCWHDGVSNMEQIT